MSRWAGRGRGWQGRWVGKGPAGYLFFFSFGVTGTVFFRSSTTKVRGGARLCAFCSVGESLAPGSGRGQGVEIGAGERRRGRGAGSQGRATPPSHGSVLLPGLVGGGARGGRAEGRGQGAEEAGQQREAEPSPGTEHGPAIAMANVLREAEHVARVAGQLEVDARHARAQGDDAARSCTEREKETNSEGGASCYFQDIDLLLTCCSMAKYTQRTQVDLIDMLVGLGLRWGNCGLIGFIIQP